MPDPTTPRIPYQAYKSKRHSQPQPQPRDDDPSPPIALAPPSPVACGLPSPPASSHSRESLDSPADTSQHPNATAHSANPSTSSSVSLDPPTSSRTARKASKFRHIPLRKQPQTPSSPLAPAHSRPGSNASLPPHIINAAPLSTLALQSEPSLPTLAAAKTASPAAEGVPLPPEPAPKPMRPTSSLPAVSVSHSTSLSSDISSKPEHRSMASRPPNKLPYRPGFQPRGVCWQRTDEFLALRKSKRDGEGEHDGKKRVERNKLERRLEKLINLHFPIHTEGRSSINTSDSPKRRPPTSRSLERRSSSIFDSDTLKNFNIRDVGGLWKNMITANLADGGTDIRAMEQRITPWEEDSSVSKCPLCVTSFHPLTNRKHHCRLCGRIICSLPPKQPQRPETCSILFVVDSKTRKIEEVGEGVDYGVRKRRNASISNTADLDSEEKFLKGVRLCRECRPILLRQQYLQERTHTPTFVRLHDAFVTLENEIDAALPQFQELILALSHNDQPTKEASAARKRILEAFAQYDALAKKIKQLPFPNGPGSSQDRIQSAILMRANLFLQKNMFPLQSLPTPSRGERSKSSSSTNGTPEPEISTPTSQHLNNNGTNELDSALAHKLQPLLEQEALLETFAEEAKAQRKFEDVKTLKTNLQEIRREIEILLDGVDVNSMNRNRNSKGKGRG